MRQKRVRMAYTLSDIETRRDETRRHREKERKKCSEGNREGKKRE